MALIELATRKPSFKTVNCVMNGCEKNNIMRLYDPQPFDAGNRVDILVEDDKTQFVILGSNRKVTAKGPLMTKTSAGVQFSSAPLFETLMLKGRKFEIIGEKYPHSDGRVGLKFIIPPVSPNEGMKLTDLNNIK